MAQEHNITLNILRWLPPAPPVVSSTLRTTSGGREDANVSMMPGDSGTLESDNTNIRHDGTDIELTTGKVIFSTFMFTINLFMLVGNVISIVTITRTRSLRQRTYYWLVLNLAVVDLLNSLTVVPLHTMWELHGLWPYGDELCKIFIVADLSFSAIAGYSTVLLSIDKYVYITKPFVYHSISAPSAAIVSVVSVWGTWISFSAASVFGDFARNKNLNETIYNNLDICNFVMTDLYAVISALFTFFIPLIILLFTSIKIMCVARKHLNQICANHERPSIPTTHSETHDVQAPTCDSPSTVMTTLPRTSIFTINSIMSTPRKSSRDIKPAKRKSTRRTCRAFGTLTIVILFFIIMFAPYWFAAIVDVGCSCIPASAYEDYLSVFYYMHSLVNPYIYMLTDRRYKKALKQLYRKSVRSKRSKDTMRTTCHSEDS